MKLVTILRIITGIFMAVGIVLFVLHFTSQYNLFWSNITIFFATVLNLTASLIVITIKKTEEPKNAQEDGQNK